MDSREKTLLKKVILSADGPSRIYLVPDVVADNLRDYCMEFCQNWLWKSPDAKKYRTGHGVCFNEDDFIEYLNKYLFPKEPSVYVEDLGWMDGKTQRQKYKDIPSFNF